MIKIRHLFILAPLACLSMALLAPMSAAQSDTPAVTPTDEIADKGWPRQFESNGNVVIVHAPQPEEWPKFETITFRAAITVQPAAQGQVAYGTIRMSADTKVAFAERLVVLTNAKIVDLSFPDVGPMEADGLSAIVRAAMPPDRARSIALDRIVAAMDPAKLDVRKVDVDTSPPTILYSDKAAILVIFLGKSRFKPIEGGNLLFAINTNWDVFRDAESGIFYLRNGTSWLTSPDLETGPWTAATSLPDALSQLPANDNWKDVRSALPLVPATKVPAVFVTHAPAELLVIEGEPQMEMIDGTRLMLVANTESDLIYSAPEKQYYLLAAGRWFRSASVAGPWVASSSKLPDDFGKIPPHSDAGRALSSVPGTPQANDAMVLASIPQKATVNRTGVTVNPTYNGDPQFVPIESTTVQYARNSPFNVFLVGEQYYCCYNGVWFIAPSPNGVWTVCDSVPAAIYTIPPTCPKFNVTYVRVYDSTPTTVVVGYTDGYYGATVAMTGVVMFGLGLAVDNEDFDDDCCWAYDYNPCYYSYGCGAYWNYGYGGYVCGGAIYGPYGGAGHVAMYNPATGVYSRAGYAYGPAGAAGYRTAYNPATGVSAGRAGGVTPYGSWGRSAVTNGDQWVRGGSRTTAAGTAGAVQGSGGGAAATVQGRFGNGASVARTSDGDLYASHNGNVYKQGDNGWEPARSSYGSQWGGGAGNNAQSYSVPQDTQSDLQQQWNNRSRGNDNVQSLGGMQSGNGWASGNRGWSSGGGGGLGGGGAVGGFGGGGGRGWGRGRR